MILGLFKKYIFIQIIFILLILSIFISYSYAQDYDANGFILRVGLNYKDINKIDENLYSTSGFDFNIVENGQILATYPLTKSKKLTIYNIDTYHIRLSKPFSSYNDLRSIIDNGKYPNCYPAFYNDKWYICYGHYKSKNDAKNDINRLSHFNPKLEIINSGIAIYADGKRQLIYGVSTKLFSLSQAASTQCSIVKYCDNSYRGGVAFWRSTDSKFSVINCIDIDEYLYGVVPKEMSGDWHIEALKAQAVAARNFAYASKNKHSAYGFDVCKTTDCQVYYGFNAEKPLSNKAVQETRGKLLYFEDELVHAYYHANSGGYTASMKNVWSSNLPYIVGVPDPYSLDAPRSTWKYTISKNELSNKLKKAGYNIGKVKYAKIDSTSSDGRVQSFSFVGTNGKVTFKKEKLRAFLGYSKLKSIFFGLDDYPDLSFNSQNISYIDKNEYKKSISSNINSHMHNYSPLMVNVIDSTSYNEIDLKNANFITARGQISASEYDAYTFKDNNGISTIISTPSINLDNHNNVIENDNSNILSNINDLNSNKPIAEPHLDNEIAFYGCGYGHGLGMSQWGAKKMAEMGIDYAQILAHYYKGSYIK